MRLRYVECFRIPSALAVLAIWSALRLSGFGLAWNTVPGISLIIAMGVALGIEFAASSNTRLSAFKWDLRWAIVALVLVTATVTSLCWMRSGPVVVDVLAVVVAIVDIWLGTNTAYRAVRRDIGANTVVTTGEQDEV